MYSQVQVYKCIGPTDVYEAPMLFIFRRTMSLTEPGGRGKCLRVAKIVTFAKQMFKYICYFLGAPSIIALGHWAPMKVNTALSIVLTNMLFKRRTKQVYYI